MASQTTLVDNAERAPDLDPLLDTQETPAAGTEAAAPPPARALYVPSPLPMVELKQHLARALEEEAASSLPTLPPPPANAAPEAALDAVPVPALARVEAKPPPPGFEKAIDQRFASMVDSDEANAKRAFPVVANKAPTPEPIASSLQPVAPSLEPIEPTVQPTAPTKPRSQKLRNAVLFALLLGLAGTAAGILHGDLTKADARNVMSTLRSAAQHVGAHLQRP